MDVSTDLFNGAVGDVSRPEDEVDVVNDFLVVHRHPVLLVTLKTGPTRKHPPLYTNSTRGISSKGSVPCVYTHAR